MTVFNELPVLYCQMCCQPTGDAYEWIGDEEWVYCVRCDVWTAHPARA